MTAEPPPREWGEGPEGDADILAFLNDTPLLLSLLYDLDLLPEQHPDHESAAWDNIFAITNHWREYALERDRELSFAQSRLAEVEKDAARYRHLRAKPHMLLHLKNSEFDAAIDEAIKRSSASSQ